MLFLLQTFSLRCQILITKQSMSRAGQYNCRYHVAGSTPFSVFFVFSFIHSVIPSREINNPHDLIQEKLKFDVKIVNTISGIIINLFNLFIFAFATLNYSNTKFQVMILCISLVVYNSIYILLMRKIKHKDLKKNNG